MPPSVNASYEPKYRKTGSGTKMFLVKSLVLKNYKSQFAQWWSLVERRKHDLSWLNGKQLRLHFTFELLKSQLWTLKGTPKSWDASNRVKSLEDCLAEAIGVDDKHFFAGSYEKIEGEKTRASVVISEYVRKTHENL